MLTVASGPDPGVKVGDIPAVVVIVAVGFGGTGAPPVGSTT